MLALLLASFFTLVELNCENLFDCQHDSLKQDGEFLPESPRHWSQSRYWRKLNNIGQTLVASSGNESLPDMIMLCEIENDSVMRDLSKRSLLRNAGYEYIMTRSADWRGIDVALMYSRFSFAPINTSVMRITPPRNDMRPTRDILYVSGRIISGDTLHVFAVHAPSRYEGERRSRPYRVSVANRINAAVDSIRRHSTSPMIIVAGDFNDYTGDSALVRLEQNHLFDISANAKGSNGAKGTYCYEGTWRSLDHIFVSNSLLSKTDSCYVFDAPFLLEDDKKYGGVKPFRTYNGYRYNGGVSDHLPLVARFRL